MILPHFHPVCEDSEVQSRGDTEQRRSQIFPPLLLSPSRAKCSQREIISPPAGSALRAGPALQSRLPLAVSEDPLQTKPGLGPCWEGPCEQSRAEQDSTERSRGWFCTRPSGPAARPPRQHPLLTSPRNELKPPCNTALYTDSSCFCNQNQSSNWFGSVWR